MTLRTSSFIFELTFVTDSLKCALRPLWEHRKPLFWKYYEPFKQPHKNHLPLMSLSARDRTSVVSEAISDADPTIAIASSFDLNFCRLATACVVLPNSDEETPNEEGKSKTARFDSKTQGCCEIRTNDDASEPESFRFDLCAVDANQENIYNTVGAPAVQAFTSGFSSAVALYGPSKGGKSSTLFSSLLPLSQAGQGLVQMDDGKGSGSDSEEMASVKTFRRPTMIKENPNLNVSSVSGLLPRAAFDIFSRLSGLQKDSDVSHELSVSILVATDKELFDLLNPSTTNSKVPILLVKEPQVSKCGTVSHSAGGSPAFAWVPQNCEKVPIKSLAGFVNELLKADKRRRTQLKQTLWARVNYVVQFTLTYATKSSLESSRRSFIRGGPPTTTRLLFVEMASNEKFRDAIDLEGNAKTSSVLDPTPSLFKAGSLLDAATAMKVFQSVSGVRKYLQSTAKVWGEQRVAKESGEPLHIAIPNAPNAIISRLLEYFIRGTGLLAPSARAHPTFFTLALCCRQGMPFEVARNALKEVVRIKGYSFSDPLSVGTIDAEGLAHLQEKFESSQTVPRTKSFTGAGAVLGNNTVLTSVAARDVVRKASMVRRKSSSGLFDQWSQTQARRRSKSRDASVGFEDLGIAVDDEVKEETGSKQAPAKIDAKTFVQKSSRQKDSGRLSKESPNEPQAPMGEKVKVGVLPAIRPPQIAKSTSSSPRTPKVAIIESLKGNKPTSPRSRSAVSLPPISPRQTPSPAKVIAQPTPPTKAKDANRRPKSNNLPLTSDSKGADRQPAALKKKLVEFGCGFRLGEDFYILPYLRVVEEIQSKIRYSNANGRFTDAELLQVQEWSALIDRIKLVMGRAVEAIITEYDGTLLPYLIEDPVSIGSQAPRRAILLWKESENGDDCGVNERLLDRIDECLHLEAAKGLEPSYCGGMPAEEISANIAKSRALKESTASLLRKFLSPKPQFREGISEKSAAADYFKEAFSDYVLEGDGLVGNRRFIKAILIASHSKLIDDPDAEGGRVDLREVCEDKFLYSAAVSDGSVDFVAPLFMQYSDDSGSALPNVDVTDVLTSAMYQQQYRIPLVERLCDTFASLPSMLALLEESKESIGPAWQEFFHDICSATKAVDRENRENRMSLIRKMMTSPWKNWPFNVSDLQLDSVWTDGLDILSRAAKDNDVKLLELLKELLHTKHFPPVWRDSGEAEQASTKLCGRKTKTLFEQLLVRNNNDFTPLLTAVFNDSQDAVRFILDAVRDIFGEATTVRLVCQETPNGTPLAIARGLNKKPSIVSALAEYDM